MTWTWRPPSDGMCSVSLETSCYLPIYLATGSPINGNALLRRRIPGPAAVFRITRHPRPYACGTPSASGRRRPDATVVSWRLSLSVTEAVDPESAEFARTYSVPTNSRAEGLPPCKERPLLRSLSEDCALIADVHPDGNCGHCQGCCSRPSCCSPSAWCSSCWLSRSGTTPWATASRYRAA